jgi:hypothetical protein
VFFFYILKSSGGQLKSDFIRRNIMEYASKGVAGAGLGTGIAGLSLGVLNSGLLNNGLGGLFGNNCGCSDSMAVNRYEMNMQKEIINRDSEIAYLKGRDAAKTDSLELYRYIDGRFNVVERELADQRVYNATNNAAMNCMQGQIAQLYSLTKLVVPNGSICPGWGDVTVSITPAPTTGA